MLKIRMLSIVMTIVLLISALIPLTFAEEAATEPTKLKNLQVGEDQAIQLREASKNEKAEVVNGNLPNGMEIKYQAESETLAALWLMSGTPTTANTFDFSVKYYDDNNTEGTIIDYTVSVYDKIFPDGTVNSPYGKTIIFNSLNKFICKLHDGTLPEDFFIFKDDESSTDYSSGWTLICNCCTKSGEYIFEIEITALNQMDDPLDDTTEIIKCYLKINDLERPAPDDCALYEDFEDELTGWTCDGFERTETENAYEGKYAMQATSKATLKTPKFKTHDNAELVLYASIPENEELEIKQLHFGDPENPDTVTYEKSIVIKGKGEWRTQTFGLLGAVCIIEFNYNGNGTAMIDLVSSTLGYDEYKTLPLAYSGIEFRTEFTGWLSSRNYEIRGELPEGITVTRKTEKAGLHVFEISGTANTPDTFVFEIRYLNNDGQIEYIEQYSQGVQNLILGDLTGEGIVNTGDAVVVLRYAADLVQLTPLQEKSGDMNSDGTVNTADAVAILQKCVTE